MRIFLKLVFACALIMMSNQCLCNVSPFGLELDKATIKDLESKYDVLKKTKYDNGNTVIYVSPKLLSLDGLKESSFMFDDSDVLQAVELTMDKSKFDETYHILSEKYKLIDKDVPRVGNKSASFAQDNCMISLEASHLSFSLNLLYVTKPFYKKIIDKQKETEKKTLETKKSIL